MNIILSDPHLYNGCFLQVAWFNCRGEKRKAEKASHSEAYTGAKKGGRKSRKRRDNGLYEFYETVHPTDDDDDDDDDDKVETPTTFPFLSLSLKEKALVSSFF